jgi:penicillin-binding protein-related factor A (putative recombinase)
VKSLSAYGGLWYVTHADGYTEVGIPDIVGCYHGKFVAFEVKLPGKQHTLKPWQARMLEKINANGGKAMMVTSVDEAMNFIYGAD